MAGSASPRTPTISRHPLGQAGCGARGVGSWATEAATGGIVTDGAAGALTEPFHSDHQTPLLLPDSRWTQTALMAKSTSKIRCGTGHVLHSPVRNKSLYGPPPEIVKMNLRPVEPPLTRARSVLNRSPPHRRTIAPHPSPSTEPCGGPSGLCLRTSASARGGVCPARWPRGHRVCEVRLSLASPKERQSVGP